MGSKRKNLLVIEVCQSYIKYIKLDMKDDIKVLVACEESQVITKAFRELGVEAYSCDIIDCSGGCPQWHIKQDVIPLLNGNCEFQTCDGVEHIINGKWDLIISHPTCFVAGTMIMTYDGVKPIEQIKEGELVLTHKGRYRKVTSIMSNTVNKISHFYAENSGHIMCTPNHPFYTKTMQRQYIGHNKSLLRTLGDFEWTMPKNFFTERNNSNEIKRQTFVSCVTDNIKEIPEYSGTEIKINKYKKKKVCTLKMNDPNFWYFIGRWLGDGWHCYKEKGRTHGFYGVAICDSKDKKEELENKIRAAGFNYYEIKKDDTCVFEICNKELSNFLLQFGRYSYGKKIPGFVTRLPDNLAKMFLNGYFESDGHISEDKIYSYSTVSKELAYGLKYMINKYLRVGVSVKETNNRGSIIEGRKVNVHPSYVSSFRPNYRTQTRYLKDEKYIYTPYKNYEEIEDTVEVYNLSVEEDESYTANGLIVHNCTYLTVTGNRWFNVERYGDKARERIKNRDEAAEFFMKFVNADCDHILIENPVGFMNTYYRKPDQIIQPWMFPPDVEAKQTCLWLKGLPKLIPGRTEAPEVKYYEWVSKKGIKKRQPLWYFNALKNAKTPEERSKIRSRTFEGVGNAIAAQYTNFLKSIKE